MKRNTLIIITLIYFSISLLYNYSLYPLIITNENSNQYFLIFLYFLSELVSFAFRKYAKKNEEKIVSTLGPIIFIEEPMSYSTLSESNNNLTTSMNISATYISTMQPFIGMKWPSFIFPAIFDFLSKFFIFHGLKILESDIIFRAIIELIIVFIFSKLMLQSKYNNFSIVIIKYEQKNNNKQQIVINIPNKKEQRVLNSFENTMKFSLDLFIIK